MIDPEAIFEGKRPDTRKLLSSGFVQNGESFVKDFPIFEGQFVVKILFSADGKADFRVLERETGDEYLPARVLGATGPFVGPIHEACEKILTELSNTCFLSDRFREGQAERIFACFKEKFSAEPEFLWSKLPDFCAFRIPGKQAWFAVAGKVEKSRFSLAGSGKADILNLKNTPEKIAERLKTGRAYPAYHMNKKYWFTTILGGTVPDEEIVPLIGESLLLAGKK